MSDNSVSGAATESLAPENLDALIKSFHSMKVASNYENTGITVTNFAENGRATTTVTVSRSMNTTPDDDLPAPPTLTEAFVSIYLSMIQALGSSLVSNGSADAWLKVLHEPEMMDDIQAAVARHGQSAFQDRSAYADIHRVFRSTCVKCELVSPNTIKLPEFDDVVFLLAEAAGITPLGASILESKKETAMQLAEYTDAERKSHEDEWSRITFTA